MVESGEVGELGRIRQIRRPDAVFAAAHRDRRPDAAAVVADVPASQGGVDKHARPSLGKLALDTAANQLDIARVRRPDGETIAVCPFKTSLLAPSRRKCVK